MVSNTRAGPDMRDQMEADTVEKCGEQLKQNSKEMEEPKLTEDGEGANRSGQSDMEEKAFVAGLYRFMEERGTPIERIPHLGFKQINLWRIYKAVEKLGGYDSVTARRLWKNVYDELGGSPGSTSAATCTRRHYERLVLPFERQLRGEEDKPLPPPKPRKQYKKSPEGKTTKSEGNRKRRQLEREGLLNVEDKTEDCGRWEMGSLSHSSPWSLSAERPPTNFCELGPVILKDTPGSSQMSRNLFPGDQPMAPAVISPLEKKKRLAQASLGITQTCTTPEKDSKERPSVIQSPGYPRGPDSSEGSPVPRSSPSSSRCSSPCSVSSDDCQALPEGSSPAPGLPKQCLQPHLTSLPYSIGVCKPMSCYPNAKNSAAYLKHHRDFQQVDPAAIKAPRPDLAWSPNYKRDNLERLSSLRPHQLSLHVTTPAGSKACWIPPMSSFNEVSPKTAVQLHPVAIPNCKFNPNVKRSTPEEITMPGKKLQLVMPLHQGEPQEKYKPSLAKPLPTHHSLYHPNATMPLSYLFPAYEKSRPIVGNQLNSLSLHPFLLPTHLMLSPSQPNSLYRHVPTGTPYSIPYDPLHRPYPIWQHQPAYTVSSLHPPYPNTKL